MKRYIMCSGGKDSMASVVLCYENGIHIDGVITAEIMFSHEKNISAEHPRHIEWFYNIAKPTIENKFGYEVTVLKSPLDYVTLFNKRIERSKFPERIGKKWGFVLGGNACYLKRDLKTRVIERWSKSQGEYEKIIGIAADEQKRLDSLYKQKNARSVLDEYGIVEAQTYGIDRKYDLLSPFYSMGRKRQGCWFCPNCSLDELAAFAKEYPEYWDELRELSKCEDSVSKYFQYNRTFEQIDRVITGMNNQLSIFDMGCF